jgi:response regulator RpfG family c-di-GMP phosphodiesterase
VDDEIDILMSLKRCFRHKDITVVEANSGAKAIQLLEQQHIDIILSDMRMPCMDGVELLSEVFQRWPHVYRMLLTGYTDMQALTDAVNHGKILSYIEKPWRNEDLNAALDTAIEEVLSQRQNSSKTDQTNKRNVQLNSYVKKLESRIEQRTRQAKKVLHRNQQFTSDLYRVLHNFISINPILDSAFAFSVSRTARNLGLQCKLSAKQINEIELAGQLCEIGLLGIDAKVASMCFAEMNYSQQQLFYSQVSCISSLLSPAHPLQAVEDLLTHQYEHIDGSGYPDNLEKTKIPMGSRILAISRDFWRFRLGKMTGYPLDNLETLKQLKKYQGKIYDIGLLDTFIAHCNNINETPKETRQPIGNLIPGMTLKDNLYGHQHTLLLSKGHELTENCIRKLKRLERLRGKKILLQVNNNENLALSETLT